jgi:hypothetical protein
MRVTTVQQGRTLDALAACARCAVTLLQLCTYWQPQGQHLEVMGHVAAQLGVVKPVVAIFFSTYLPPCLQPVDEQRIWWRMQFDDLLSICFSELSV